MVAIWSPRDGNGMAAWLRGGGSGRVRRGCPAVAMGDDVLASWSPRRNGNVVEVVVWRGGTDMRQCRLVVVAS